MTNLTNLAFRKMMLNGRLNELMSKAVEEGIAETKQALASNSRFMRPACFTPRKVIGDPPTSTELNADFEIPKHVLQAEDKKS